MLSPRGEYNTNESSNDGTTSQEKAQLHHTGKTTLQGQGAPHCLAHLIQDLSEAQPGGVGFIWDTAELKPPASHVVSLLGQRSLIDASKCGLDAYRNTRVWQNLMPRCLTSR